jgi:hypothetical protein
MGCFWTSTVDSYSTGWSRIMANSYNYVTRESDQRIHGYSVRCVKN